MLSIVSRFRALWANLFRRERIERELEAEVGGYARLLEEENMRRGNEADERIAPPVSSWAAPSRSRKKSAAPVPAPGSRRFGETFGSARACSANPRASPLLRSLCWR